MPRPEQPADQFGGYTIAVNQCDWGHVARKATWLYLVNVPSGLLTFPEPREPTHYVGCDTSWRRRQKESGRSITKACSAQQRRRTPPAFAEYLVSLARASVTPAGSGD